LAALETHMAAMIAEIYGETGATFATAAAGGAFAALGQGLKYVACQATCLVPVLGIPIRMTIAGGTIESLGHAIVAHYEPKHQGKLFAKPPKPPTPTDDAEKQPKPTDEKPADD